MTGILLDGATVVSAVGLMVAGAAPAEMVSVPPKSGSLAMWAVIVVSQV